MAKRKDSNVIALEPNADGKIVIDIDALDIDPNYDYVLKRTVIETFTLSKSAKQRSQGIDANIPTETHVLPMLAKAKLNDSKEKPQIRHKAKFTDEPAFATPSSSHRYSRPPMHPRHLITLLRIHEELMHRSRSSFVERSEWISLANDVATIIHCLDCVGRLTPGPTATLTADLDVIRKEAEDRLDTGMIRGGLQREGVGGNFLPLTQLEWLREKIQKVAADVDKIKADLDRAR